MGKNRWYTLIPLFVVIIVAFFLYRIGLSDSSYQGLPTVPCIDSTKPFVQNYSLHISIIISGKKLLIPENFGKDYGNCLHEIFTVDSSGLVYVKTNEKENFTLGNFFDVWHSTFNQDQLFGYRTGDKHTLTVFVNGKAVNTYRDTPLFEGTDIQIVYK